MLTYINSDAFVSEHIEHISTCDFNVLFTTRLNVSTFTKQTRPPFGSHVYCVYKYTTTEVCFYCFNSADRSVSSSNEKINPKNSLF